jgi:hypothetical protein
MEDGIPAFAGLLFIQEGYRATSALNRRMDKMGSIGRACFYLLLVVCLGTMACTSQLFRNFGRISFSDEVTRAFENYSVNTDFRYYTSGPDVYPHVIIGLHRDYRLDTQSLWKEVAMTPEVMQNIAGNMKEKSSDRQRFLYGFELIDPKGKPIGVWYSIMTARTCLQMNEDGTVRIDTPDLDTFEQLNGETGMFMESG